MSSSRAQQVSAGLGVWALSFPLTTSCGLLRDPFVFYPVQRPGGPKRPGRGLLGGSVRRGAVGVRSCGLCCAQTCGVVTRSACRPGQPPERCFPHACPQGIQFLIENDLLQSSAEAVAQFLYKGEGLNKTVIGDYLGER